MWKQTIGGLAAAALCLTLAGCGGTPSPVLRYPEGEARSAGPTRPAQATVESTAASTAHRTASSGGTNPTAAQANWGAVNGAQPVSALSASAREGNAALSARLLGALHRRDGNVFVSPVSLQLCLGMVANGARGNTLAQMLALFGEKSLDALNRSSRDLLTLLAGNPEQSFRAANGIWTDTAYEGQLLPAFTKANADYYGARIACAPMNNALVPVINRWVSDNTAGRIRDLLKPSLGRETMMILVNTLLFEGKWQHPFPEESTRDGAFHAPGGDITLPMMRQTVRGAAWYEDDEVKASSLDYRDGRTAMVLAVPKDLNAFVSSLDGEKLRRLADGGTSGQVLLDLSMPRFTLGYRTQLKDTLAALGMSDAVTPGRADFTGIAAGAAGRGLYITEAVQQTALEISEAGTIAAAATAMAAGLAASPNPERRTLTIDRPFFCAIVDKPTGAILFAGAIHTPAAA